MKGHSRLWLPRLLIPFAALLALVIFATPATADVAATSQPPNLYQVTAGSAAVDQRGYQTGSPVDPLPAENIALADTSITSDSTPSTGAHAAYIEPPASAQALTNLNQIPIPYPTQVDEYCAGCSSPQSGNADGNVKQGFDNGRIGISGGTATASADLYTASTQASNGGLTVAPTDQVSPLLGVFLNKLAGAMTQPSAPNICAVQSSYTQALPSLPVALPSPPALPSTPALPALPPVPCISGPGASGNVTPALVTSGSVTSSSTVTSDSSGTNVSTTSSMHNLGLLGGLLSVSGLTTSVTASSDGTAANTKVNTSVTVGNVCFTNTCNLNITAAGICSAGQSGGACANDPINSQLRGLGFNVCRLGSAATGQGTTAVSGTATGLLVEWHVNQQNQPDPTYYSTDLCSPSAPTPHGGFAGISAYVVVGESSAQLEASPASAAATGVSPGGGGGFGGSPSGYFGSGGTTSTNNAASKPSTFSIAGVRIDRRWLYLMLFATIETSLLYNVTMLARSRRRMV